MGRALVIKGANFTTNAIDQVTPSPLTKLVDYDGVCEGEVITYAVDLISTSAPDWVCFVKFGWLGGRTGEIRLFNITSSDNVIQFGFTSNNQFYKSAAVAYSATTVHQVDNSVRKIGFKKQNSHVYVTLDGVAWTQTELTPTANTGTVYLFGGAGGIGTPNDTELRMTVWNDPTYDISPLFSA